MKWMRLGNQSNLGLPSALALGYPETLCFSGVGVIINLFMSLHLSCSRLNQELVAVVGDVIMPPLDAVHTMHTMPT